MSQDEELCPVARTARLIGRKWMLLILRDLAGGTKRFSELQKSLGISPRTLSSRLRELEEVGVVARYYHAEVPPRVEYSLTEMGRGLIPIIEDMRVYGEVWQKF